MATTTNSKIIKATQQKIYNAFTDKNALEFWLAPNNMTGKIHDLDFKVGGGYNISLFHLDSKTAYTDRTLRICKRTFKIQARKRFCSISTGQTNAYKFNNQNCEV